MIEGIPLDGIGIGSGWALVFVCVWMIFTGRLVTRREVDAKDQQLDLKDAQLTEQGKQISALLNSAIPTVNAVLTSLHEAAELGPHPGGDDR